MSSFREQWSNPKIKLGVMAGGFLLLVVIAAIVWGFTKKSAPSQNAGNSGGSQTNNTNHASGSQGQNSGTATTSPNSASSTADNTQNSAAQVSTQPISLADATVAAQRSTGTTTAQATATLKTSGAWSVVQINIGSNTAVAIFNGNQMVIAPGTGFSESYLLKYGVPADIASSVGN